MWIIKSFLIIVLCIAVMVFGYYAGRNLKSFSIKEIETGNRYLYTSIAFAVITTIIAVVWKI